MERILSLVVCAGLGAGCGPGGGTDSLPPPGFEHCWTPDDEDPYLVYSAGLSGPASTQDDTIVFQQDTIRLGESAHDYTLQMAEDELDVSGPRVRDAFEDMRSRSEESVRLLAENFYLLPEVHLIDEDDKPVGRSPCSGYEWAVFEAEHPGARGVWSVSQVGYSCDGKLAAFYAEHYCGIVYIRGEVVFAQRLDDIWIFGERWDTFRS